MSETQGTPEWFAARLGKVTASRLADVVAKTKTGWGASRANYMAELIAERLTATPAEKFSNAAMAWGTETEPEARAAYSFRVDVDVAEVGFIEHPSIPMTGASPDGFVTDDGLLELKCPNAATHIDTLLGEPIAGKYITQMQWQMACTQRKWCDFASYDPRMPEEMRLFVKRVVRDDAMIAGLERDVTAFLAELDEKVSALKERYGIAAPSIAPEHAKAAQLAGVEAFRLKTRLLGSLRELRSKPEFLTWVRESQGELDQLPLEHRREIDNEFLRLQGSAEKKTS